MAQQLIFTSAVAGLNPGSSGYCTVARSESMREAVAARLEQWSVYAHAARGPRPVVCAHRILNLRGSSFNVLTRIVDSGLDYTGRTNFLAHHVVLQTHEIHEACSPAEIFSSWNGWITEWHGSPRYVDDENFSLHTIPRTTQMPARAWAEAAGDAGAAALLLKHGPGNTSARSVDLIVPVGHEKGLLKLYAESLHLADSVGENAPSWAVTFTTFLQAENDPTDFRWRGFWPDSQLRATGETLCDFATGAIPPIPSGLLTELARTGSRKTMRQTESTAQKSEPIGMASSARAFMTAGAPAMNRRISRSSSRTQSTSQNPHGWSKMPRWVWITLLCILPIAVAVGWVIGRGSERAYLNKMPYSFEVSSSALTGRNSVGATPTPDPIAIDRPTDTQRSTAGPERSTSPEQSAASLQQNIETTSSREPNSSLSSIRASDLAGIALRQDGATQLTPNKLASTSPPPTTPPIRDRNALLEALPGSGRIYVVSLDVASSKKVTLPTDSSLSEVLRLQTAERYNVAFQQTSIDLRDGHKTRCDFIEESTQVPIEPKTNSELFIGEPPLYSFTANQLQLEDNNAFPAWIAFTPKPDSNALPFYILVLTRDPVAQPAPIKIGRSLLRIDGQKLLVRDSDEVSHCLNAWVDKTGHSLLFALKCSSLKFPEPITSGSATEIDFKSVRDKLMSSDASLSQPQLPPRATSPPELEVLQSDIVAIRTSKVFSLKGFSGKDGVVDRLDTLPEPLNGKIFYKYIREQLVVGFCKGSNGALGDTEKAIAEDILAGAPSDRIQALRSVPAKIEQQKNNKSNNIPDFKKNADTFVRLWQVAFNDKDLQERKAFLTSDVTPVTPRVNEVLPIAKTMVDDINGLTPDISKYSKIWLEASDGEQHFTMAEFDPP